MASQRILEYLKIAIGQRSQKSQLQSQSQSQIENRNRNLENRTLNSMIAIAKCCDCDAIVSPDFYINSCDVMKL